MLLLLLALKNPRNPFFSFSTASLLSETLRLGSETITIENFYISAIKISILIHSGLMLYFYELAMLWTAVSCKCQILRFLFHQTSIFSKFVPISSEVKWNNKVINLVNFWSQFSTPQDCLTPSISLQLPPHQLSWMSDVIRSYLTGNKH